MTVLSPEDRQRIEMEKAKAENELRRVRDVLSYGVRRHHWAAYDAEIYRVGTVVPAEKTAALYERLLAAVDAQGPVATPCEFNGCQYAKLEANLAMAKAAEIATLKAERDALQAELEKREKYEEDRRQLIAAADRALHPALPPAPPKDGE